MFPWRGCRGKFAQALGSSPQPRVISDSFKRDLLNRVDIVDIIQRHLQLKKAGANFSACCPFHNEKSPSFTVSPAKQFYHCFGCGAHGDAIGFLMEYSGLGYIEAIKELATGAGMAMPDFEPRFGKKKEQTGPDLYDIMQRATQYYREQLKSSPRAVEYLKMRGLSGQIAARFGIGYAPDGWQNLQALFPNYDDQSLKEVGLVIENDAGKRYDRFRDRIMFPIVNQRGFVIGFGGRVIGAGEPKYLNSPETPLFHKGSTLYNIASARQAAHDGAQKGVPVIAVEGYVDVIAMVTAGFPATVAPLGTALTEDQLGLLWKMADEPVLCFDGDNAGLRAAYRAVELAMPRLKPGKSLKFALLPQGQDPDDLMRSAGREAVAEVIAGARPLAAMLWTRETEGHSFDTPERRAALEARIHEVTAGIGDDAVRKYYRQDFQTRLAQFFAPAQAPRGNFPLRGQGRGEGERWRERSKTGGMGQWPRSDAPQRPGVGSRNMPYVVVSQQMASSPLHRGHRTTVPKREALILQAALNYPWLLHDHLEELASLEFRHADAERLKCALIDIAAHAAAADAEAIKTELASRNLSEAMERIAASITTSSVWGARPDAAPEDVLVTWQQLVALHRQWHSLTKELKDAEQALGQDNSEANYLRLRDVKARLARMDGTEALIEGFGVSSGRGARSL